MIGRAEPAALADRAGRRGAAPDRRVRPLARPRAELGQAELVELPVVDERRLGPGADHHVERLLHPLAAVVAPQPVADELVLVVVGPVPDADVEAAAREVVEEGQLGGQADRMAQGELDHGEADADPRGARRHDAGERDRIAVDALAREVVLGEPDAVEAGGLREAGLRDQRRGWRAKSASGERRVSERQPAESHRSAAAPHLERAPVREGDLLAGDELEQHGLAAPRLALRARAEAPARSPSGRSTRSA